MLTTCRRAWTSARKKTKENMKALCGLLYKYAVPRQYVQSNLILSQYLIINDKGTERRRTGLTDKELEAIKKA